MASPQPSDSPNANPNAGRDQRQHERTELSIEMRVILLSQGDGGVWEPGEERTCVSRDLSAGGVGLRMDRALDEGQPVLVFVPGIERTVRVFGRVCHRQEAEGGGTGGAWIGVRFYGMPVELERTDWVRSIAEAA